MAELPNPWTFDSAVHAVADTAVAASSPPSPGAAAVTISESAPSLPAQVDEPSTAGAALRLAAPAAFSSDTQYMPELFSDYARRRSMPIVSPPLPKVERNIDQIALNAVCAALNIHPRNLDEDPPPLFLRSPAFRPEHTHGIVGSLLKLAGVSR